MLPRIVLMNHSAPFLCTIQRRFKTEPFDLYLYHQSESSIAEVEQLAPDVIVLARRYGYPASDLDFIQRFRQSPALRSVPIILSLIVGMPMPNRENLGLIVIVSQPEFSDFEEIVAAVHKTMKVSNAT